MITIQRVRVRWSAAARGAPQTNAHRGLCRPAMLSPSLPAGAVVIHEVLADEATGYVRQDEVAKGGIERARNLDLWLSPGTSTMVVDRLMVDGSGYRGRQRDEDDLAPFAAYAQDAVSVFLAEVADVGAAGFEDP